MERKNAWEKYPKGEKRDAVFAFAEEYRKFLIDNGINPDERYFLKD